MGGSGHGMTQLIKGIGIGIVLILAIIGTMSILDKNPKNDNQQSNQITAVNHVPAPTISVTKDNSPSPTSINTGSSDKISLTEDERSDKTNSSFKPILENEKTPDSIKKEAETKNIAEIKYGVLRLASIDYETKNSLKASYEVFDQDDKTVAKSTDADETSFRLPAGKYKVISTLSPPIGTTRKTEAVQSTQFVTIVADTVIQKLFKMEPPSTIGVLQVSAKNGKTNQALRAHFIIQKENGETVAERQNVTNTLFKLDAGSYKVTARSGENSDFRTVVIDAGESTQQVFILQEANLQGKVLVRIFDTYSNRPVLANIVITTVAGKTVQELKSVSKTEISLPVGNYKIHVAGPFGESEKNIHVVSGQTINEVFRFDSPDNDEKNKDKDSKSNSQQITDNVTISPVDVKAPNDSTDITPEPSSIDESKTGSLKLIAQSNNNQTPVKSNFYVQTLSGQHIDRKIYSDSANFNLKPGTYKITVRAKGKKNLIKNIQIFAGQEAHEVFSLIGVKQPSTLPTSSTSGDLKPPKNNVISSGFLHVAMQPEKNTHFIINTQSGKKIVELTSVPNGRFKLDTGKYNVIAILNGQRRSKLIRIAKGRTSRVKFSSSDFEVQRQQSSNPNQGILRSRIVDQTGRPLKGNITVTNLQGKVVSRANNVSIGVFRLPPNSHIVSVNYRGLQGSERVKIIKGETTMQTFTIAP